MALILSVCAQKRLFIENFSNFRRALIDIMYNGCTVEKYSTAYNVKYFSTKNYQETSTKKTEIYYGILTRQIRALKIFSLLTSTGGLLAQPFLYSKAIESGNTGAVLGIFAFIGFLTVTTPLLIHIITRKYVTHLYYDAKEDKYIAKTYSLFVQTKELVFTPDDVVVPDVTGMFTSCIIKGIPLFLEQKFFHDSTHYIRIMGYDKPVDFKLSNKNTLNQTITMDTEYKGHINKK
ncbi:transmembrane protein 70 homolog, mitochondrial [Formica exsecta]|uniref:transmembrane protein 70 homolog, mitochondrial n=1 Tax=Formica exsecta TaxID=72781 RepID=UPI001141529E|nr:transmembrane protein 70 homolog, mitochondrial [Formica exsecta]